MTCRAIRRLFEAIGVFVVLFAGLALAYNQFIMSLSNWRIDGNGDLAVVTNDVHWQSDAGEGKEAAAGGAKQFMLLARQGDGKWVRKIVIYNSDQPG